LDKEGLGVVGPGEAKEALMKGLVPVNWQGQKVPLQMGRGMPIVHKLLPLLLGEGRDGVNSSWRLRENCNWPLHKSCKLFNPENPDSDNLKFIFVTLQPECPCPLSRKK
jgi:hypothetical protein